MLNKMEIRKRWKRPGGGEKSDEYAGGAGRGRLEMVKFKEKSEK